MTRIFLQVPSREVDKSDGKFWSLWNKDTKEFFLQFAFKNAQPDKKAPGPPGLPGPAGLGLAPPPPAAAILPPPPPRPPMPAAGLPPPPMPPAAIPVGMVPPPPTFNPVPPPPPMM